MYFLKFDHVDFSYYSNTGEIQVLQDMSFEIERGSFIAVVGRFRMWKVYDIIVDRRTSTTNGRVYYILF